MVPCPGTRFVTPLNLPYMLRRVGQPEYRMAGWWELLSTPGPSAWLLQKKETTCSLSQQSPTFLAPEMRAWWIVLGWFKHIIFIVHFISNLMLSLIWQEVLVWDLKVGDPCFKILAYFWRRTGLPLNIEGIWRQQNESVSYLTYWEPMAVRTKQP